MQQAWHRGKRQLLEALLETSRYEHALDAGCGSGLVSHCLLGWARRVTGVDINPQSIRFAQRTFAAGSDRLNFVHSSIFEFTQRPFDLIVCMEFIEHLAEPQNRYLLTHLRSLAAPGARLVLTTPNYCSLWPLVEWVLDRGSLTPALRGHQHLSRFHPFKLERLLRDTGWLPQELGSFSGLAPFLALVSPSLAHACQQRLLADPQKRVRTCRNLLYTDCRSSAQHPPPRKNP